MAGGITAAVIGGAAVLGGAYMSSQGQQNAASTQANAAAQQQSNLLAAGQTASQQFTPYANYGTTPLSSLTANNPYFNQQFTAADLQSNLAPNYQFMLGQGLGATSENVNVGGGGSNANMARTQFAENYASNAYQNAFTNFQNQRNAIAGIDLANAGLGLQGATGSANAQLGTATNVANIGLGAANAQAASQIAQGNIYGSAANSLGSIGYATALGQNNANSGSALSSLSSQNWNAPQIGGAPSGGYSNMGGSGYGIGGFSPSSPA